MLWCVSIACHVKFAQHPKPPSGRGPNREPTESAYSSQHLEAEGEELLVGRQDVAVAATAAAASLG